MLPLSPTISIMRMRRVPTILALLFAPTLALAQAKAPYYPPAGSWEHRKPEQVGLTQKAVPLLQAAVRTDSSYPDAHAFLGIVLLRSHRQPETGRAQLHEYLRLVPSGQMSQQVRQVLRVATTPAPTRGRPSH